MLKKIVFTGFGLLLLASPVVASAQTTSELQGKIESLLAQLRTLQVQLLQLNTGSTEAPGSQGVAPFMTGGGRFCPALYRSLSRGIRGDDVTGIQRFLIGEGFLSNDSATGFLGPVTEEAVQKWQAAHGIVSSGSPGSTGWGVIGPATRAWIARWCNSADTQIFSASPSSGPVPLGVAFGISAPSGSYMLDFGDGANTSIQVPSIVCIKAPCVPPLQRLNHTYTSAGTYTATLASATMTGSVTIFVYSSTASAPSISISSPAAGSNVAQGGTLTISWSSENAPTGSAVALWLTSVGGGNLGLIARDQATSGSYSWSVPSAAQTSSGCPPGASAFDCISALADASGPECPADSVNVCRSAVVAGSYKTVASLYTPGNAYLGGYPGPGVIQPTYLSTSRSGTFTVGSLITTSGTTTTTTTTSTSTLSAAPTSGQAPLAITFRGTVASTGPYSLDFGDGTPALSLSFTEGLCSDGTTFGICGLSLDGASHTYTSAGIYTAQLRKNIAGCDPNPPAGSAACMSVGGYQVVGTVTITVGGSTGGLLTASPTSGATPLAVTFTSTYSGSIKRQGGGLAALDFGDGTSEPLCSGYYSTCQTPATFHHTYTHPGVYVATLRGDAGVVGNMRITVTGTSILTAIPVSGASPLAVTFTSTYSGSIKRQGGGLAALDFGDGTSQPLCGTLYSTCTGPITIHHTYRHPGTYVATITGAAGVLGNVRVTVTGAPLLVVAPSTGTSPLTVLFTSAYSGSIKRQGGGFATLDFGDGTSQALCGVGTNITAYGTCTPTTFRHTYRYPGVYVATLTGTDDIAGVCPETGCFTGVLGNVEVVVNGSSAQTANTSYLANALTALESALKALLAKLGL